MNLAQNNIAAYCPEQTVHHELCLCDPLLEFASLLGEEETNLSSTLRTQDVICGRDSFAKGHPGNIKYTKLIRSFRPKYKLTKKREAKKAITETIIRLVHESGGRFIVEKNGVWVEQDADKIHDKVSHGLRSKTINDELNDRKRQADAMAQREDRLYDKVLATQQKIFDELLEQYQETDLARNSDEFF